jgi:hypothetical protein
MSNLSLAKQMFFIFLLCAITPIVRAGLVQGANGDFCAS